MQTKQLQIDYVIVSGDLMSDADWDYTIPGHVARIKNISSLIKQYLPGVKAFFAIGNHEGVPIDKSAFIYRSQSISFSFAPHWVPPHLRIDDLYEGMVEAWRDWIPADQHDSIRK
jgi:sphingomyelin phosphodiesterase